jgi:hypothetical protein
VIRDRIFISYRRSDVPWAASELRTVLTEQFGEQAVFLERLHNELARATFVRVVIDPQWNESDDHGLARLSDARDWVRVEVQTALADRDADAIPVLIDATDAQQSRAMILAR